MKNIFVLILMLLQFNGWSQSTNLLSGKYSLTELKNILIPLDQWKPFPSIRDREGWSAADQDMMKGYLKEAEGYLHYSWPSIPATASLLIERTGDRQTYERISFEKRHVLGTLLLAEIYENKGRFIDPIIDGVWSICEESFWGASAHLPRSREYRGLMDVSKPFVELFSAETATYLAWVDYFLGPQLDAVSPQIRKRIYYETNKRIFEPLMTQPHGWMQANANGRRPNNWNPWICSNWLNAALLLEKDPNRRAEMINKLLHVLDQFLNPYPADGGCDEGPGYWGAAAASLYDNIAMLNLATNNAFRYAFEQEKIKNMGRYIYRAQISETYFLDFADADPRPGMAASMIYRFGKDINDSDMMQFGAYYRKPEAGRIGNFQFFRNFFALYMQDEFKNASKGMPLPADVWLPDLEVMIARDHKGSTAGWFLAAKGGNNDESHNHNDIGNYIVYYDGLPLIIDVGRGTYTRKTFSDQRYDIWSNCSEYHNCPTVNDANQLPGAAYKAENVSYKAQNDYAAFSLDMAAAYSKEAGLLHCNRKIRLDRGKGVTVEDLIEQKVGSQITEHLMTCYPAEVLKAGLVAIHYKDANGAVQDKFIQYDPAKMKVAVEKVALTAMEDKGIIEKWGDTIYRISFSLEKPAAKSKIGFRITDRR